jgi:hypothetical protein
MMEAMIKRNKKQMQELREEWVSGRRLILSYDQHKEDHARIDEWIVTLLEKENRSDEDEYIVGCIYHSLNFDIPFPATEGVRRELLHMVRMKISDPTWTKFPL